MKKSIILMFLCFIVVFCACEGAKGIQGEQGNQGIPGKAGEVTIIEGILSKGDLFDGGYGYDYWFIEFTKTLEKSVITVHVREGSDNPWEVPTWSFVGKSIFIFDDSKVDPGFYCRIAIIE